ncbi:MAG TPA: hypothetical protein VIT67_02845 [Povalibacter sp.]
MSALVLLLCSQVSSADNAADTYSLSFASFAPINSDIFIADGDGNHAWALFADPEQDFNAVFSPDGRWLVFTSTRAGSADLYRASVADHSALERIVDDAAYDDQAAISPDGKHIAFVSSRTGNADIWVLDVTTKALRNVSQHPAGDFRPAWSPDGQWLAFTSDRESTNPRGPGGFAILQSTEIFIMRPDGSNVRRRTSAAAVAGSPRWSPDGKQIVFYRATLAAAGDIAAARRLRGTTQIVTLDLASDALNDVTTAEGEKRSPQWLADGRITYASDGPEGGLEFVKGSAGARGEFKSPSWSRDGKRMLFHREVDRRWPPHQRVHSLDPRFQLLRVGVFPSWSPTGERLISNDQTAGILHNSVISMRPDGSDRTVLFTDPQKSALAPVWSQQGDRIAFALGQFFQSVKGPARADIATIRADGSDLQVLTDGQSNLGFPSWSPDGKRLVFRAATQGANALHILDIETRQRRVLIAGNSHYNFPAWSPKDDVIAFTSSMDGNYEIYTIRTDGTHLKRLTNSPHVDAHSSWSSDGKWLAFASGRGGFKDEVLLYQANPQAYGEIFVMRADGSDPHPLTDNQFEDSTAGWLPNH